jgi:hypothetical protein
MFEDFVDSQYANVSIGSAGIVSPKDNYHRPTVPGIEIHTEPSQGSIRSASSSCAMQQDPCCRTLMIFRGWRGGTTLPLVAFAGATGDGHPLTPLIYSRP